MRPMRIAYVINSVEGGGAALPVPAIAGVLRHEGTEVRVFALTGRDRRALQPMIDTGLDPLVRNDGETDHLAAARWLRQAISAWGATHIWTSLTRATILGLIIGPQLGLPVICWQHAAFLKPWNRRLLCLLQSRASLWVGDSRSVSELTVQRIGVSPNRLMTWPIFSADPATPEAAPWREGEPLRIGSLGRLHPVKGYDVLIAALAKLKADGFTAPAPLQITLAGEGAERGQLEAMIREAGLSNIEMPGYTDDPHSFLAQQHLYVQPSRSEGFCIGAHEAMMSELPVIVSRVGELGHSVIEGITGHVVPPADVDALANALGRMIGDPASLYPMGQAARAHMLDRFSQARFQEAGAAIMKKIRQASA